MNTCLFALGFADLDYLGSRFGAVWHETYKHLRTPHFNHHHPRFRFFHQEDSALLAPKPIHRIIRRRASVWRHQDNQAAKEAAVVVGEVGHLGQTLTGKRLLNPRGEELADGWGIQEIFPQVRREIPVNVLMVAYEDDMEFLGVAVVADTQNGG